MPPINTSLDILYYALAGAAALVAVFVCLVLYNLFLSLRDVRLVTTDVRKKLESFWAVVELVREKLQVGGAVFKLLAHGLKDVADSLKDNKKTGKK